MVKHGDKAVSCPYLIYGSRLRRLIHPVVLLVQHVDERPANALDQLLHLTNTNTHE